ncbi:hypothetical protein [Phenylobacterium sp.]|uniref:hypothetical protein n=1 Tax=Phenylobacterium sp. TaxID=1871053 RepID=UPI0027363C70|nr:hypothetical protein [Phenylobacterium sp.]MDP3854396.1 hypothetical protein [Phenylobacterium sp.]
MTFGFKAFRQSMFPNAEFGQRVAQAAPLSIMSETPAAWTPDRPVFNPGLSYKPPSKFEAYWGTPLERTGKTRAEHLGEIGSLLRDRDEHYIPAPSVDLSPPATPTLTGRGGSSGASDVLARVRARYGL